LINQGYNQNAGKPEIYQQIVEFSKYFEDMIDEVEDQPLVLGSRNTATSDPGTTPE